MPIRPATYSDLLPASKCLARAFKNEALFGKYMHPYQDQYPNDMYLYFLHQLRTIWATGNPDDHLLVSYTSQYRSREAQSATKFDQTITGIAHWTRKRSRPEQQSYTQTFSKSLISAYNYLESFPYPNRALCPSRTSITSQFAPYCAHFWTGSRAEVYDLTLLGIDLNAQGTGHGKALVAWGFERAKTEGIGCSVVGAEGTEKFYQRCGFDVVAGEIADFGGKENPLVREGVAGGVVLFWDNGRSLEGVEEYKET